MRIEDLARAIEARLVVPNENHGCEVTRVYGANTMSDLIANAGGDTLLVTALSTTQLIRVAELMDVPGICLVDSTAPSPELLAQARSAGTALLVAPGTLESTLRRLKAFLSGSGARPA